jgi:hypothetical protein
MTEQRVLTLRFDMHMKGQGWASLTHEVMADGNPTGIFQVKRTEKGKVVRCVLAAGANQDEDVFDMLAATTGQATAWINARLDAREVARRPNAAARPQYPGENMDTLYE